MVHAISPSNFTPLGKEGRTEREGKTDMQYFSSTEDAGISQPVMFDVDIHAIFIFYT